MQTLEPPHFLNNHLGHSISLWMNDEIKVCPPLDENLYTDVCIVGGGLVGLTCAYFLNKQKLSVVLLEAGAIGGGQTARTTGHLTWALDDRFADLEKLFGLKGAQTAAESHLTAIRMIEKIVQEEEIDCDFEKLNAYLFAGSEDTLKTLEKEWDTLQKLNVPVKKIDHSPLNSFDTGPCLEFADHAQFHIFKYLKGLTDILIKRNVKIYAHTHVNRIQENSVCQVMTDDHHIVTAKSVIVATNTPVNDRFMIHSKQAPYQTYVIAGLVPKNSIAKGLYYDTLDPYHYIRLQKHETDPTVEWLIIGGEDEKTGQEVEDVSLKYQKLEEWARYRFPMLQQIEYHWSGQVMEPVDSLAFIGKNPHDENIYIATGDSGNGLTHGTIAGLILTDLIIKGFHPWAELYQPNRKTLQALDEFTKENLNVAAQYGDWIRPGEVTSLSQIRPGTGAVIREGLTKVAAYCDNEGKMHCYSAVCPHLGCLVKWNQGEECWDCPCHGSRFSVEGQVLNGPAIDNLTPRSDII